MVLPFFSERMKAERASTLDVAIIAMDARQLFELTCGATLMLDPNDERAALYLEEISALLSGRPLVAFGLEKVSEPETLGVRSLCRPQSDSARLRRWRGKASSAISRRRTPTRRGQRISASRFVL